MSYDEDDDLLKPTTFKEKLKDKASDIFYGCLAIATFAFAAYNSRHGTMIVQEKNNQAVHQMYDIKKSNFVHYNDSINQKIR